MGAGVVDDKGYQRWDGARVGVSVVFVGGNGVGSGVGADVGFGDRNRILSVVRFIDYAVALLSVCNIWLYSSITNLT